MRICLAICLLMMSVRTLAGSVTTRDGKTFQGQLAITPAGLTVAPASGPATTVELPNLRRAVFEEATTRPVLATSWNHTDIGKVHAAGSATEKDGVYTMTGSGWGAWSPRDSGQFVYWPLEGDGQIIARLVSRGDDCGGVMAGVMIRASLEPDANAAAGIVYPSGEFRLNRRPMEGWGVAVEHKVGTPVPEWIRLMRNGSAFSISRSKDGRFWQASKPVPVEMPAKALVGLFVAAGTNSRAAPAVFDEVRIVPGTPAATCFDGAAGPNSGVVLTDGTMVAGVPRTLADGKVLLYPRFARDGQVLDWPVTEEQRAAAIKQNLTIPIVQVARLRFSPEPPDLSALNPGGGPGVLLMTGDFLEAEIDRLGYSQYMDVNSILFGVKRLDAPREVICAVLRDAKPDAALYEVRLRDRSVLYAKSIAVDGEFITVESTILGILKYPVSQISLIEVR